MAFLIFVNYRQISAVYFVSGLSEISPVDVQGQQQGHYAGQQQGQVFGGQFVAVELKIDKQAQD